MERVLLDFGAFFGGGTMMISATQMRSGMLVIHNGELHRVHEVVHKTPGNLRGFVQAKLRNVRSGSMNEHRFGSTDRVEKASLDETEMEYLYSDAAGHHFMRGSVRTNPSRRRRRSWGPTRSSGSAGFGRSVSTSAE